MRKVQCADWLSDTVSLLETQVGYIDITLALWHAMASACQGRRWAQLKPKRAGAPGSSPRFGLA